MLTPGENTSNSGVNNKPEQLSGVVGPSHDAFTTFAVGPFGTHGDMPGPEKNKPEPQGSQIPKTAADAGKAVSEFAKTVWREGSAATIEGGKIVSKEVAAKVGEGLEKWGGKPSERFTIVGEIIKVLPIIGPSKTYAEAWKKWNDGVQKSDEGLKSQARIECLVALADLKIDILLLGSAKVATAVGRIARGILGAAYLDRIGRSLGQPSRDLVHNLAERVSKTEPAKGIAEYLLTRISPNIPAEEISKEEAKIQEDLANMVNKDEEK